MRRDKATGLRSCRSFEKGLVKLSGLAVLCYIMFFFFLLLFLRSSHSEGGR